MNLYNKLRERKWNEKAHYVSFKQKNDAALRAFHYTCCLDKSDKRFLLMLRIFLCLWSSVQELEVNDYVNTQYKV